MKESRARDATQAVDPSIAAFSRQLAARLAERPPPSAADIDAALDAAQPPQRVRGFSTLLTLAFCLGVAVCLGINLLLPPRPDAAPSSPAAGTAANTAATAKVAAARPQ